MRHTSRSVEVDPLWLALGVLDLLDLDLLAMQLVHVGDHIHTLHTGQRGRRGRATPTHTSHAHRGRRTRLPPAACWAARVPSALPPVHLSTTCLPIYYLSTYPLSAYPWRAWTSMSTKEGTASSSSLSVALNAPVAEPGLMKSLPSARAWGAAWGAA